MNVFWRAVAMEWRRLVTIRSTWVISALCLLASGGLGAAVALTADRTADLNLAASVINPGQPAPTPILLGVLGIMAWGHDYRFGTIRPVLSLLPQRKALAAGRFCVLSIWLVAVATLAVSCAWLAALAASGGALAPFLGGSPIPRMTLGAVVFGVGCGWLGMGLGALIRSMPIAVAGLFALPAVIEPLGGMIVGHIHENAQVWLPFYVVGQVLAQTPAPTGPSAAVGALIFLGIALAVVAAAFASFVRRDA